MSKNVVVIPFEVIVKSQNFLERVTKAFFYFAVIVTLFYLCLMSFIGATYPFGVGKYKSDGSFYLQKHLPTFGPISLNFKNPIMKTNDYNGKYLDSNIDENRNTTQLQEINSNKNKSSNVPKNIFQTNHWVDEMSPVHYPWPNHTQCMDFTIKFAKNNTFKPRALVSFPGSGNSWLRYLIECSTGVFTGSLYNSIRIYEKGFYGEFRNSGDGSTIVQKTHFDTIFARKDSLNSGVSKYNIDLFQYRGILVIRNPYKAIFSYWNFLKTNDQIEHVNTLNTSDPAWVHHVEYSAEKWGSVISSWVQNSDDLLIIQYEELKKNPIAEIKKILKYMNVPINEKRLDCLMQRDNIEGPFHREKKTLNKKLQIESKLSTNIISIPHIYNSIYPSPLDTAISDKIQEINILFGHEGIPIHLDYTLPN